MDNAKFIRVVAGHIETGQLFRSGILNNDEIAKRVRAAADEIDQLRKTLNDIAEMTDADNPESYRCDDREGCLDAVFSVATKASQSNG